MCERRGNEVDFEAVYRENFAHGYRFLLSLCRDAHLAEELTQDTFDRAFRKGGQFNGRCELKTWLCSIARNAFAEDLDAVCARIQDLWENWFNA